MTDSVKRSVIALGIDAPNTELLMDALDSGELPFLAWMRSNGATGNYSYTKLFLNESCWDVFLTGRATTHPGCCFDAQKYLYAVLPIHRDSASLPLFYSGHASHRICVFDMVAPMSSDLNGLQVAGWGSETNTFAPLSQPEWLLANLESVHGLYPPIEDGLKLMIDPISGKPERSVSLPSLYIKKDLLKLQRQLCESVRRRTAICAELLQAEDWDLFLSLYSESHTANHMLWHLGEGALPSQADESPEGNSPLIEVYREIDRSLARLYTLARHDTSFIVYTIDQVSANHMDVPSMALLPELMYRWAFPGETAIGSTSEVGSPVPSRRYDYGEHWKAEVWKTVGEAAQALISSPFEQEASGDPLSWNPANWFRNLWPRMRAFALPSVADGYVRLNVRGREVEGLVDAAEFLPTLHELRDLLLRCVNPRTGKFLAHDVLIMRETPFESSHLPPDLIVRWGDSGPPADVLDSEEFGRIGPLPFFCSGGHVMHGTEVSNLLLAVGPGIKPGEKLRHGRLEDPAGHHPCSCRPPSN